jgi:hypothetical protein
MPTRVNPIPPHTLRRFAGGAGASPSPSPGCPPRAQRTPQEEVEARLARLPPGLWARLYPFQQEGVRFGLSRGARFLLGDEMGLGKTAQALCVAACHADDWPLLIVAPASVRAVWAAAVQEWLPPGLRPAGARLALLTDGRVRALLAAPAACAPILTQLLIFLLRPEATKLPHVLACLFFCTALPNLPLFWPPPSPPPPCRRRPASWPRWRPPPARPASPSWATTWCPRLRPRWRPSAPASSSPTSRTRSRASTPSARRRWGGWCAARGARCWCRARPRCRARSSSSRRQVPQARRRCACMHEGPCAPQQQQQRQRQQQKCSAARAAFHATNAQFCRGTKRKKPNVAAARPLPPAPCPLPSTAGGNAAPRAAGLPAGVRPALLRRPRGVLLAGGNPGGGRPGPARRLVRGGAAGAAGAGAAAAEDQGGGGRLGWAGVHALQPHHSLSPRLQFLLLLH